MATSVRPAVACTPLCTPSRATSRGASRRASAARYTTASSRLSGARSRRPGQERGSPWSAARPSSSLPTPQVNRDEAYLCLWRGNNKLKLVIVFSCQVWSPSISCSSWYPVNLLHLPLLVVASQHQTHLFVVLALSLKGNTLVEV